MEQLFKVRSIDYGDWEKEKGIENIKERKKRGNNIITYKICMSDKCSKWIPKYL